jgi:heat-inducible transcriptional repressor
MLTAKSIIKRSGKQDREYRVLLGLVEYYLNTGLPVGSNTLKEAGFGDLSSATIRNYFSSLEKDGFLIQQHASGGRIPTHLAYRTYANEYLDSSELLSADHGILKELRNQETREIASYLQKAAEALSATAQTAVFLSAPRFDHDFIVTLKVIPIDHERCLCVIVTDFGVIRTEILPVNVKLTAFLAKRIESYFHWRITSHDKPENLDPEEEKLAQKLYNELMMRYIVGYSHFIDVELYRTGLSRLLHYPEFRDTSALSNSLALFENAQKMRLLVKDCCKSRRLKCWIGDDLANYTSETPDCSVIAVPYFVNQNPAGAIGILGPTRIPYRQLFGQLKGFAESISEGLTRNLFKFKITFRQPQEKHEALEQQELGLLLLEDRRQTRRKY